MYELKPVIHNFNITLPKCMYQMKPLNSSNSIAKLANGFQDEQHSMDDGDDVSDLAIENFQRQIQQCLKGSSGMATLAVQQENLLKQLDSLKKQLLSIRSQFGLKEGKTNKTIVNPQSNQKSTEKEIFKKHDDIVVNSSPDCIPYGLLALKNAWKGIFNINVTCHSHSSVAELNSEAKEFQTKITQKTCPEEDTHIKIVLIWKNSEHTEMITSAATYVPIYGEVNILRYLARIGPKEFDYESDNNINCNEMDAILDISYQLPCCCGNKTKSQLLKSLNDYLQKQTYYGGKKWSIIDIGAFSALKRSLWLTQKDLTVDLKKWFERMKSITKV